MRALIDFISGLIKSIKIWFLHIFGRIKVFRWPMFVIYDPRGYDIKASEIRKAMDLARKGDVFVRRYRNYLDGYFIPGRFSHSGLYVGDGIIIHAMSEGVQKIDVIDFLRCDGFAILRPITRGEGDREAIVESAAALAHKFLGSGYDFDFDADTSDKLYCHELVRKCYPSLDIPRLVPTLWNGMIKSSKKAYLAQSFFESDDFDLVYDSDFSVTR